MKSISKYIVVLAAVFVLMAGSGVLAAGIDSAGIGSEIGKIKPTGNTLPTSPALPGSFDIPEVELDDSIIISTGIYAGPVSLGGMTPTQAKEALGDYLDNVMGSPFTIKKGENAYTTTLTDMGFSYNTDVVLQEAAFIGQHGLLVQRYKDITDLKYDKKVIEVPFVVDELKFDEYITANVAASDKPAVNASISRVSGEFVVTPETVGTATDADQTEAAILALLKKDIKTDMSVEAVIRTDVPTVTSSDLNQISARLGTYSTKYSSSKPGRKENVRVGSSNINGTVVMPGQQISASELMKKREPENGYQLATEYNNGDSVEAYGGGVCQVATTLYQAALRAELQIDERHCHSMLVGYVDPSYDAAISWGNKDVKITNNTGYAIYIAASADGTTLTFSIYGKEYRPSNRSISFESVIIERVTSETKIVEDPTQPVGFVEKKGTNRDKCRSYLVKKVYVDGNLTETIKFKEDYYAASFQTIKQGTLVVPEPSSDPAQNPAQPSAPTEPTLPTTVDPTPALPPEDPSASGEH